MTGTCKQKCCKIPYSYLLQIECHDSVIFLVHIQEKVLKGEKETSPAKITGLMEKQIIVCIGAKKMSCVL